MIGMVGPNQRVIPYGKKWAVRPEKGKKPSEVFDTKEKALKRAREIAKNYGSKVMHHRSDGTMHSSSKPRGKNKKKKPWWKFW